MEKNFSTFYQKNNCQGICELFKKLFIVKALNLMKSKDKIFFSNNYAAGKQNRTAGRDYQHFIFNNTNKIQFYVESK